MAILTVYNNRVTIKLNDGTQSGKVVTKNVSFPALARNLGMTDSQFGDAVLAVSNAYERIATKEIYVVEYNKVSRITSV